MSTIEQQSECEQKFSELVELLTKIGQCDKPCKVDVNFDGAKFASWQVHASNLTADEWNPALQTKRVTGGISAENTMAKLHRGE
jgi:hypothetical protein